MTFKLERSWLIARHKLKNIPPSNGLIGAWNRQPARSVPSQPRSSALHDCADRILNDNYHLSGAIRCNVLRVMWFPTVERAGSGARRHPIGWFWSPPVEGRNTGIVFRARGFVFDRQGSGVCCVVYRLVGKPDLFVFLNRTFFLLSVKILLATADAWHILDDFWN